MAQLKLTRHDVLPKLNYSLLPASTPKNVKLFFYRPLASGL